MGDVFAGDITVSQEAAAVRVALERHVEQRVVELRLGNIKAEFTSQFAKQADPGIVVRCAIVGVDHRDEAAIRGCDQVDFRIGLG